MEIVRLRTGIPYKSIALIFVELGALYLSTLVPLLSAIYPPNSRHCADYPLSTGAPCGNHALSYVAVSQNVLKNQSSDFNTSIGHCTYVDRCAYVLEDGYRVPASTQEHQRVVQPDL